MRAKFVKFILGCFLGVLTTHSHASLSILLYHQVSLSKKYSITEENFTEQMDYLKKEGYTFLDYRQLEEAFQKNTDFSDKKYVAITFDDGWRNQMKAVKILADRNIPAIFFINGEPISKKWGGFLTFENLAEIESNPLFVIADHSYSHKLKILHDPELLKEDYAKNIDFLKKHTNRATLAYAYPYGSKKTNYIEYLKSQNVPLVYGTNGIKIRNSNRVSKYDIPRFTITNEVPFSLFKHYVR